MSLHVFAAFVTHHGTAANNRGENAGNTTTLQKLVWNGQPHSTVSAEAIRFALRRRLDELEKDSCNRTFNDDTRLNEWKDPSFKGWDGSASKGGKVFADDDLLGFMKAEAGKDENTKGSTTARRAVLELTRAVSLSPWPGDVVFNAASPGATPSAAKKGSDNPVPYGAEVHATRYQYAMAMTPERLRDRSRAALAIRSLSALGEVAGNHARFLFDFSPESVIFRVTQDPAPRLLYCFEEARGVVSFPALVRHVKAGDILAKELVIGGAAGQDLSAEDRAALAGATFVAGVRPAAEEICKRIMG